MSDYPSLTEMGITRFNEISHYMLWQEGQEVDVLKVFYKRSRGSFLPESRKYRFGRSAKTVRSESGAIEVYEISPFLQKAVTELDTLVHKRKATHDEKARLLVELDLLEQYFQDKVEEIRASVKRLS